MTSPGRATVAALERVLKGAARVPVLASFPVVATKRSTAWAVVETRISVAAAATFETNRIRASGAVTELRRRLCNQRTSIERDRDRCLRSRSAARPSGKVQTRGLCVPPSPRVCLYRVTACYLSWALTRIPAHDFRLNYTQVRNQTDC